MDWNNVVAVDCKKCMELGKVFSERLRRKGSSKIFWCDGCNTTKTEDQLKEESET